MSRHHKVKQRSIEWYDLREGMLTASNMDMVVTPETLKISAQAAKLRDRLLAEKWSHEPMDLFQSPWMERGQDLEYQAFGGYETLTDQETEPGGFWTNDAGTVGCSPDRLVGAPGLLEIKCPLLPTQIHAALAKDEATKSHRIQVQTQLWITEREWCDLFHFHPLLVLPATRVYRDDKVIRMLSVVADTFVEQLQKAWAELVEKYGPPPERATVAPPPTPVLDGASEEDVDALFAAMRKQQEKGNA